MADDKKKKGKDEPVDEAAAAAAAAEKKAKREAAAAEGKARAKKAKESEGLTREASDDDAPARSGKPRLQVAYETEVRQQLMKEFGYKNPMQVPRLVKITLNMG